LIRVGIPLGCLVVMIASIAFIILYNYNNNREDALILTDHLLETLDRQIAAEVQDYLSPASEMVKLATNIVKDPSMSINSRAQIEPLAIQILKNYPQLTIFSIADAEGNFIMSKKQPDGRIDTKIIDRRGNTKEVKWIRRDLSGAVIAEEIVTNDTYDARVRPWYTGAVKTNGLYWTDVYIFFTNQKPGITAAMPVFDSDNKLQGVLGADIEIEEISTFLKNLTIGRNGKALIIEENGRLVAYHEAGRMLKKVGDTLQPLTLDELGDPVLSRAYNRFKLEGHGRRTLIVDRQRYLNSVSALPAAVVRGWSVMIVVPEDDFVGFVKENIGKSLWMAIFIMALASTLAGLLVYQGIRADRNVREVLNRKQEVEAQSQAFSTLASDAAVFDPADTESLCHLTEIVSGAAAVRRTSIWQIDSDGSRLVCMDCYDSESNGHTSGTLFEFEDYPEISEFFQRQETIAIADTVEETQFSALHRAYFQPMGCRALLAVPVVCHDQSRGAIWFEHEGQARLWDLEDIAFGKAIAGLLALRFSAHQQHAPPLMPGDGASEVGGREGRQDITSDQADPQPETEPPAAPEQFGPTPDTRVEPVGGDSIPLSSLTKDRGYDPDSLKGNVYSDVTVLVLRFIDPISLARNIGADNSRSAIDNLACRFEEMVAARDLDYWNIVSDQIICAAGLGEASSDHSKTIADVALRLQDHCIHLFADLDKRMAFRIGIDRGAVVGSQMGRQQTSYNIWGDAVGTALKMADTGVIGGIHVSEAVYRRLRGSFVFKVRGLYYLKDCGEISTYLLTGRL
jgi:hypothetical protein